MAATLAFPWYLWAIFILVAIWSVIWKGLALWKAAKKGDKAWFIVLLVVNTAGLLEILYYGYFSERKPTSPE